MSKQKIIEYEGRKHIVNSDDDYIINSSNDDFYLSDDLSYFPEKIEEPTLDDLRKHFGGKVSFGVDPKTILGSEPKKLK